MPHPAVISLASGYVPYPTPPEVLAELQRAPPAATAFDTPTAGLPALRTALAERFAGISSEQVVITPGAKAALFAVLRTVLQPGDEVLVPTPSWFGFDALVEAAGGVVRPIPLDAADNYALLPATLAGALTPRTRLLLFSNPNNPTGRIYSAAEVAALLAVLAPRPEVVVLSDEIYERISFGRPAPSLLSFADVHQRHVVVHGFSKCLGLVGWGVGYLVVPPALAAAVARWQHQTSGAAAVPSQLAALAATRAAGPIAAGLVARLAPRRAQLLAGLTQLGVPYTQPEGTYYVFPDFRAWLNPALPAAEASGELAARLLTGGLEVVDGALCHAPGFARLSCALPEPELAEALARLGRALRS